MQFDQSLAARPEIITQSLRLRRPCSYDVNSIVQIVGDWEVARTLARVPHPYSAADANYFLNEIVPNEWVWAITLMDTDKLIGMVALIPDDRTDTAELGYWVARAHWRQGIATEAARAILQYGWDTLVLRQITSGYFEENPASGRVLEKLGFVETGRVMRPCLATGTTLPLVEMLLLPK